MTPPVPITETHIPVAGVMRCCLASVAIEYVDAGSMVSEGDKSKCKHCGLGFTLRKPIRGKMVWYPDDFEFDPANC
jgi:hypothetical protein